MFHFSPLWWKLLWQKPSSSIKKEKVSSRKVKNFRRFKIFLAPNKVQTQYPKSSQDFMSPQSLSLSCSIPFWHQISIYPKRTCYISLYNLLLIYRHIFVQYSQLPLFWTYMSSQIWIVMHNNNNNNNNNNSNNNNNIFKKKKKKG